MEKIENYDIIPIGRAKDLTNQFLGDYNVLYRTTPPDEASGTGKSFWLCQCQKCNKFFVKSGTILTSGLNECVCKYDLTNQRFGRWTVLNKTELTTKSRGTIWHCRCDCGVEKDVSADCLRRGESQSCGCLAKEKAAENARKTRIDLTNQRFGQLVALYPIYSTENNQHTRWICKCDCGNTISVDMGNLRAGRTISCGCLHSKNEEKIIQLLLNNNIQFEFQYKFKDLPNKTFDFFVNQEYIIEFDGVQHFEYTNRGWDTEEHFIRTHKSDLEKNKYCFDNNIPIIRIPYNAVYDIKDLQIQFTRFLLTPENETQYYNQKI